MTKLHKRIFYYVNTKKFCGQIAVDQKGEIYKKNTAPCYQWMDGKKFGNLLNWLKYKNYLISCKKIGEETDAF